MPTWQQDCRSREWNHRACIYIRNPGVSGEGPGDLTNDGNTNAQDGVILRNLLGSGTPGPVFNIGDLNCNGYVNAQDMTLFRQMLGQPPGPSGQVP